MAISGPAPPFEEGGSGRLGERETSPDTARDTRTQAAALAELRKLNQRRTRLIRNLSRVYSLDSDEIEVTTRRKLNGADHRNLIARTHDYLIYRSGEPALALIDYDRKGMPLSVAAKVEELGGLWSALVSLLPELANVARVVRGSTSAGLFRDDIGNELARLGGQHVFLAVQDGSDIERFLKTLHARCLLAGFGWLMVGAGGQLLERSILDRVVGSPEGLLFQGAPVLDPPLAQGAAARRPTATEGQMLGTVSACPRARR